MNKKDRATTYGGIQEYGRWKFRGYVVRHKSRGTAGPFQPSLLIDQFSLDPDYQDFYVGFSIIHYGRRGDNAIFFRVGTWGDMFELFHQAYYREREGTDYTKCATSDPIACVHDLPIVMHEMELISKAADASMDAETFGRDYLRMPCLSTKPLT
jgi:hypothetical protein